MGYSLDWLVLSNLRELQHKGIITREQTEKSYAAFDILVNSRNGAIRYFDALSSMTPDEIRSAIKEALDECPTNES